MRGGGVVLCGGQSQRMGRDKPSLPFGPESMLQRVVGLLSQAAEPVVVVASPGQELPPLPAAIAVLRDRHQHLGPLEGLAVGLGYLAGQQAAGPIEAAYVTGCDVPLLVPAFVQRMFQLAEEVDVAVLHREGFDEPLAAVYRTCVVEHAEALLAAGRLRPAYLFDRVRTRRVRPE